MKNIKWHLTLLVSCLILVGCVVENNAETKSDKPTTELYKYTSEENENASAYLSITHRHDVITNFEIYYEVAITDAYLSDLGVKSQEEAGQLLERIFYEYSLPELVELEKLDGVETEISFPRESVWRLLIGIDPAIADFHEVSRIVGTGDLELLEDVGTTSASEYRKMFQIIGFEKVK
ncbi:hypothetical protein HO929_07890 [Streptococcus suis]|uniref:hypothetical protein n=1 Tax=Streptococcus suis TaxID=1307 RepID=UPI0005CE5FFF|nr:hypothetical protein [Streptococcus suis]MCO8200901.1 hypothetical protein [Streptococcus suis]MCO8218475.1 hypothetical protein [Streptococcus suis]NQI17558.1 hypothetical protein [Streptococcus suis]NQP01096.1 hypothetical protein [Streptococcus suis]NQP29890.1 hypothetical protein [Streptococcus suis]